MFPVANEYLFLGQLILVLALSWVAFKLGREALITWIALQALSANLFVLKQISLFGWQAAAGDALAIGSFLSLNGLQEVFGRESAKKATQICFFALLAFALVAQLHLVYLPSGHDTTQLAFETILSPSPRLLVASTATFVVVQQCSLYLFAWLQAALPQWGFAMRTAAVLMVAECLDTLLFTWTGLYGLVASIGDVMLVSMAVKLMGVAFFAILLRAKEPIPLKFFLDFRNYFDRFSIKSLFSNWELSGFECCLHGLQGRCFRHIKSIWRKLCRCNPCKNHLEYGHSEFENRL